MVWWCVLDVLVCLIEDVFFLQGIVGLVDFGLVLLGYVGIVGGLGQVGQGGVVGGQGKQLGQVVGMIVLG